MNRLPIELAPRDGTAILLFNKEVRQWMVGAYHASGEAGWYSDAFRYFGQFQGDALGRHQRFWPDWWSPLPAPPPVNRVDQAQWRLAAEVGGRSRDEDVYPIPPAAGRGLAAHGPLPSRR